MTGTGSDEVDFCGLNGRCSLTAFHGRGADVGALPESRLPEFLCNTGAREAATGWSGEDGGAGREAVRCTSRAPVRSAPLGSAQPSEAAAPAATAAGAALPTAGTSPAFNGAKPGDPLEVGCCGAGWGGGLRSLWSRLADGRAVRTMPGIPMSVNAAGTSAHATHRGSSAVDARLSDVGRKRLPHFPGDRGRRDALEWHYYK